MNIVFILTDDQRMGTLQYMPNVMAEMQTRGIIFERAFVTSSLCCPSRASILTGQYATKNGVFSNQRPFGGARVFNDTTTLAVWMQNAGYKTALIGKYLNAYDKISPHIPPGWDYWFSFLHTSFYNYPVNDNGKKYQEKTKYSTDLIKSFPPPPPPIPDAKLFSTFNHHPQSYNEFDVDDKPNYIQQIPRFNASFKKQVKTGHLFAQKQGIYDNTTIIFLSDNGYMWGEHRLTGKVLPYEEAIRVPMAISSPYIKKTQTDTNSLVLNIDVAPTILDLTATPRPEQWELDGESLVEFLSTNKALKRDYFFIENLEEAPQKGAPSITNRVTNWGVRTHNAKYIEYVTGESEFYDLIKDPFEQENQINNTAYKARIDSLRTLANTRKAQMLATDKELQEFNDLKGRKSSERDSSDDEPTQ
ncbi:MAG: sulfatase-like hydrolase/transferase [Sphingobacteriales bacterium]|nr:sulfatase-like hydrolase/transferase [Sphingobacteriales bacterium]